MLKKSFRLTKEKDFKRILRAGKSFFSSGYKIRVLPNNLDHSRFAVVVSAKVSKKAVVRNRLKRQTVEVISLNLAKINPGYDFAIYLQKAAIGREFEQLLSELCLILAKNRLMS